MSPPSSSQSIPPPEQARRRQAQAALRARDPELELISENFPEGSLYQYTVTSDGRRLFTYLGGGFERIFGERPAQLPADIAWLTQRIHPADEPGMAAAGDRSHREMTPFKHEVRIRAADGTERWVSFRSQPRAIADGSVVWDGAVIDVTDSHRAEVSARRQVDFLAALNETTLELLGRRNVTELLQALADRAAMLLNSPHAEISLLQDGDLVVRAYSKGADFLANDRVTRAEPALSWRAIDTGLPVVAERYAEHPDSRAFYRDRGMRAAAVFPITRGIERVGVLGIARNVPDAPFTPEDLREGMLLAQMAALVFHNAAIYEEAVHEAEARTRALRESEERFRAVFDKSPSILGLLTLPEGRIVELNAAALAAFGYTRDQAVGKTTVDLGLWTDFELRAHYLRRLATERAVTGFEAQMRRANGEVFTALHSGSVLTIAGQPYMLSSVEDITARRQAEVARERSLALMRATLESTADGILVVNPDGRIETFNRNFAEMWRLAADESHGDAAEERLLHAILDQLSEPELFLASVRDVYSGSEEEVLDVLHCKDGRVFERYSRPQRIGSRPAGRVWSFRDITESRRAEAALRESEERFRVLAEVSPVGIFSSDPTGQCVFVNGRWCEIAGMTAAEAMGEGWTRALHPDDRKGVADNWAEAVRAGESSAAEFRFVKPDGTIVPSASRARR
jgi:PAS domain S-box-containing protein